METFVESEQLTDRAEELSINADLPKIEYSTITVIVS